MPLQARAFALGPFGTDGIAAPLQATLAKSQAGPFLSKAALRGARLRGSEAPWGTGVQPPSRRSQCELFASVPTQCVASRGPKRNDDVETPGVLAY